MTAPEVQTPKEMACPAWCGELHEDDVADGYLCTGAATVIELPPSEEFARGRVQQSATVYRQQWISETGETPGSAETIQLALNGGDGATLSQEEARQVAAVLTFHADRIAADHAGATR
jgi:hypothetical protein